MKTKHFLFLLALLLPGLNMAQPKEGGLKTKDGVLFFLNDGKNSYTFNLEGDVDVSSLPLITLDGVMFQFETESRERYGRNDREALSLYMLLEKTYAEEMHDAELKISNFPFDHDNKWMNSWKMDIPKITIEEAYIPIKVRYFLDIALDDIFLRLIYNSISGDDEEALEILLGLMEYFDFYDDGIDVEVLHKNVMEGKNYYKQ